MGNVYGPRGCPAVGNGMPGLPIRKRPQVGMSIKQVLSGQVAFGANIEFPTPISDWGKCFLTLSGDNGGGYTYSLTDFAVIDTQSIYFNQLSGASSYRFELGPRVNKSGMDLYWGGIGSFSTGLYWKVVEYENAVRQTLFTGRAVDMAGTTYVDLRYPIRAAEKTFVSIRPWASSTGVPDEIPGSGLVHKIGLTGPICAGTQYRTQLRAFMDTPSQLRLTANNTYTNGFFYVSLVELD